MPGPNKSLFTVDPHAVVAFQVHGQVAQVLDVLLHVFFVDLGKNEAQALFLQCVVDFTLDIMGRREASLIQARMSLKQRFDAREGKRTLLIR
jgi:hypothetical protein